jgi:hypothetical protein
LRIFQTKRIAVQYCDANLESLAGKAKVDNVPIDQYADVQWLVIGWRVSKTKWCWPNVPATRSGYQTIGTFTN